MNFSWVQNLLSSSVANFVIILAALPAIIKLHVDLEMWTDYLETEKRLDYVNGQTEAFDFIIIGGGSAGSVVANRLSEAEKHSVLVLEIGGNPSHVSEVPFFSDAALGSVMAVNYNSVPQKHCCKAAEGQIMRIPRGRALGGSSSINGMIYVRGNSKDFDRWANLTRDSAWSYENVLQYFKKSEDYHGNYKLGATHSRGGNLYVGKPSFDVPVKSYFFDAVSEKGYPIGDMNAEFGSGPVFSYPETNIKDGKRHTSYAAFLQPIFNRKNLSIYRYSRAIKIHFDKNKRAIGVTYTRHGRTHYVEARKEIIVSAGVIDSPRLLLLSGIGPKTHLDAIGIETVVDLPVGRNYQDHVMTRFTVAFNDSVSVIKGRDLTVEAIYNYMQNRTGPLSTVQAKTGMGFLTSSGLEDKTWPDLYTIILGQGIEAPAAESLISFNTPAFNNHTGSVGQDACIVSVVLTRPNSPPGEIQLASRNPDDDPVIDPRILADPSDSRRIAEGIMFMVDLFETTASFRKLGAHVIPTFLKSCEHLTFKSREYWECYTQQVARSGFHTVGTCKMGRTSDPTAVVDSKLRVLNTRGLRVIDASIMPVIVTGNPYATTVMIGEMGAEFVKQEWQKQ